MIIYRESRIWALVLLENNEHFAIWFTFRAEVVTTPIRGCRYMCLVLTYYKCADVNDIENDTQKQKHKNTFSNDVLMLLYKLIYP